MRKKVKKKIKKFVKKGRKLARKGMKRGKVLVKQVWQDPMTQEFVRAEKKLVTSTLKRLGKRVKSELRKRR